jgi:anti-sigma regulatory factor (Ser/Thr protein kinase)
VAPPSDQDEQAFGRPDARVNGSESRWPAVLELSLRADMVSASIARDRFAAWLRAHAWSPAHAEDLVLVLSEAVTNSIEHGYRVDVDTYGHPGMVRVRAEILPDTPGYRFVHLVVADQGQWQEPVRAPEPGHGLQLVQSIVAEMTIDGTSRGTTLTIRSRPSPRQPT